MKIKKLISLSLMAILSDVTNKSRVLVTHQMDVIQEICNRVAIL